MEIWNEILGNQVLVCSVAGWTVAQVLKTIIDVVLNRSFNPERLFGSGGMPSSHSATVCALTTAKQAQLLNSVFFENILNLDGVLLQEKLKEYVGHTPLQVAAGAVLGIGMTLVISSFY